MGTEKIESPWTGYARQSPGFSWGYGELSCEKEDARNRRSDLLASTSRLRLSLDQLRDRFGFIGRGHGATACSPCSLPEPACHQSTYSAADVSPLSKREMGGMGSSRAQADK